MPRIINTKTGREYIVSDYQLAFIKAKVGKTRGLKIIETTMPDEVKALMERRSQMKQ